MKIRVPRAAVLLAAVTFSGLPALCGEEAMLPISAGPATPQTNLGEKRILGIIPNYQTVSDPSQQVAPLTAREKWALFARSTTDPFVVANVILGASLSHMREGIPQYGGDSSGFGQRMGAAFADLSAQGMLTGALFAQMLHQDPRYFRRGSQSRLLTRIGYSLSRVAVTRSDSGRQVTNWSFMLGTASAIGLSNAYYPDASRTGSVMLSRIGSTVIGSALGNLLPEFWPDVQNLQRKLFRHRRTPERMDPREMIPTQVHPSD